MRDKEVSLPLERQRRVQRNKEWISVSRFIPGKMMDMQHILTISLCLTALGSDQTRVSV